MILLLDRILIDLLQHYLVITNINFQIGKLFFKGWWQLKLPNLREKKQKESYTKKH